MTNHDLDEAAGSLPDGAIVLRRALLGVGGGLVLVFLAGIAAGYASAVIDRGEAGLAEAGIIAGIVLLAGLVGYAMWRFWPREVPEPVSRRVRSARNVLLATAAIGLPLGFIIGMTDGGLESLMSNGPVSPALAGLYIALWLAVFPLTLVWWRTIDEHEADAYRDGALFAAHAYLLVTPAWWMATRAGWLPAQEPMLVLLFVSSVWSAVWFYRRYL